MNWKYFNGFLFEFRQKYATLKEIIFNMTLYPQAPEHQSIQEHGEYSSYCFLNSIQRIPNFLIDFDSELLPKQKQYFFDIYSRVNGIITSGSNQKENELAKLEMEYLNTQNMYIPSIVQYILQSPSLLEEVRNLYKKTLSGHNTEPKK